MKNLYIIYLVASTFWMLLSACSSDEHADIQGKGLLQLSVGIDSQTTDIETKAATADICKVQILNNKGEIIKKYDDAKDIPSDLWLLAGEYTVSASLGTPKKAEFDHPCYAGKQNISILANKSTQQEIKCRLVQSKVSIRATDAVKNSFKDYPVTVSMGADKLTFAKGATTPGYFYGAKGDEDLLCEVAAVTNDGTKISKKYTIEDIQPHTHYIINLDYKSNYEDGGLKFEISLSEEPDATDQEMGVALKKYPVLSYNSATPTYVFTKEDGIKKKAVAIKIEGYPKLNELTLVGSFITNILQKETPLNLLRLTTEEREDLANAGIHFTDITTETIKNLSCETTTVSFDINTTKDFPKEILGIKAQDSYSKERMIELEISVSPSTVTTLETPSGEVRSTYATLHGKRIIPGAQLAFEYRAENELNWITIAAEPEKDEVIISNLLSNTKYFYRATDGSSPAGEFTFITEEALQLPNFNFDTWASKGSNPTTWYMNSDAEDSFWGSGNEGVTFALAGGHESNTSPVSGNEAVKGKAARLETIKVSVVGLAAGNLFTGAFDMNISNPLSSVKFGRPFISRPTSLTGYYKYKGGIISENKPDSCHIYVSLENWGTEKNRPKDPKIIAYGELKQSNEISAYTNFSILLDYKIEDEKPTHIVLVATASVEGDKYIGHIGSTLYIDEFSFNYNK